MFHCSSQLFVLAFIAFGSGKNPAWKSCTRNPNYGVSQAAGKYFHKTNLNLHKLRVNFGPWAQILAPSFAHNACISDFWLYKQYHRGPHTISCFVVMEAHLDSKGWPLTFTLVYWYEQHKGPVIYILCDPMDDPPSCRVALRGL